jgi:hypothetical protein
MLTLTSIVLTSAFALAANDRSAMTKEVGGGVAGIACPCTGDLDGTGTVDAADLALLLGGWGSAGAADLDGSGSTDASDLAVLLGAWGVCAGAPANDLCGDAIEIEPGVIEFCTIGANTDGPDYTQGSPCAVFGYASVYGDVWYSFTAIGDGELTVSTCGVTWDTRLAVYGSIFAGPIGCPSNQIGLVNLLGCNDDATGCNLASKVTIPVQGGHQYKIRVGGFNGYTGVGSLNVTFKSAGWSCFEAIEVNDVNAVTVYGTTLDNTASSDESPCGNGDVVAEWYTFQSACPGENAEITISTCDPATDFDTVLSVWKEGLNGCTTQLEECNDDATGTSCQIAGLQRKSRVSFLTDPGAVYYVRVAGYQAAKGNFALKFTTDQCNN